MPRFATVILVTIALVCCALAALAGFVFVVHYHNHRDTLAGYALLAFVASLCFALLFCYLADCAERHTRSLPYRLQRNRARRLRAAIRA